MSEFIAEAQVLVVPNTAAFAASLKTQLTAAVAAAGPVVIPVTAAPLAKGTAAFAAETHVATTAIAEETVAVEALGAAHVQAAAKTEVATRASREAAVAHSQAARGIAAETLSLTGLRGATLAASGPFLAGATAAIIFGKSIQAASDETEQINKTIEIFGNSAKEIEDFSKTTATSLGISSEAALEAAGIFGNLFRSIKISQPVAADMSETLVRLASDLASFNNASPERTLEALRAGLVGQARPLRVFGVFLSQARAQQAALVATGKESVKQLTNQELVQARFNIILQDTTIAQGDFARTSDRLANQSRILSAQLSDAAVTIGNQLIPVVLLAVQDVNLLIEAFRKLGGLRIKLPGTESGGSLDQLKGKLEDIFGKRPTKDFLINIAFPGVGTTINNLELINKALKSLGVGSEAAAQSTDRVGQSLERASEHGRGAANGIAVAVDQINHLLIASQHASAALEILNLKIETGLAPGGRPGQEANLRQQIEEDKKAVAAADKGSRELRQALEALRSDQQALAALQQQDEQDQKDAAAKIKRAATERKRLAREAAQAQQEATQAFIDSFAPAQQRLQNRLTTAQAFGTLGQQIALNKRIVEQDRQEIAAIKERIRHLKLHGDALKVAQAAITALNQEIFNTRTAILQLQADRKQAIADARQNHLEAQLAIAETTKSTKDDIAAEKALIAFDKAQIRRLAALKKQGKATRDEIAQLDALRVDLAQRNEALKKLKGEKEKGDQTAKEFFAFLQTQAGFAANLLGNLIPGGSTSGLVGGVATATSSQMDQTLRQVAGGFEQPRGAVNAVSAAGRERGVRPVQVDTTNQLLRMILRVLQNTNGRLGHPEARYNDHALRAAFDGVHGN